MRVAAATRVRGTIRVPGDKSISHRATLFNALADGQAMVDNLAPGADCASTLACLERLGVEMEQQGDRVHLHGVGPRGFREPADVLDCGNSGTTMRLLSGILAGAGTFAVLTGDASLRRRPMARVVEPLRAMGARIDGRADGRLAPLVFQRSAHLTGRRHDLAVASAQVKSALLLAGLYAEGETVVREPSQSRDHTERMLASMGASLLRQEDGSCLMRPPGRALAAQDVHVPGDFSSAAFWLALAVVHPDAEIRITDVGVNPTRTGFLTILRQMGAEVMLENERQEAGEPVADLVARGSTLRATDVSGALIPLAIDELPLVALLGSFAEGETVVRDAGELRVKESDRVQAVADGMSALGADVVPTTDGWRIRAAPLRAARTDARHDHRMAMLFALAGTVGRGAEIDAADAVSVSYPQFWQHLAEVTGG